MLFEYIKNCCFCLKKRALMWCVFSMLSMGLGMGKNPIDGPGSSDSAFGMANWAVLIFYFAVLMGMGIYFVRREKGIDDFF